jgi:hypothetical protein
MTLRTRWTNWRTKAQLRKLKKEHSRIAKKAKEKHDDGMLEAWEDDLHFEG